jgi:hypothetical protein
VQIYISARNCQGVGHITGSHSVKAFSTVPPHSKMMSVASQKNTVPSMMISFEKTVKNQVEPG